MAAHTDLPIELQPFYAQAVPAIPDSVRATIRDGWGLMGAVGRRRLIERLGREQDPTLRVLLASLAATKALLGMKEDAGKSLSDNQALLEAAKAHWGSPARLFSNPKEVTS